MFVPEVAQTGDGMEIPDLFRGAVADATAAGLPVLLGLSDFIKHDAPWGEREWKALAARAALFARATDSAQVVLAPVNEAVYPDAATWMPVRDRLLGVVRRAAPRHTLMWGGQEWGSWRSLLQTQPPADPNTVVEVHDYEGGDAGAVEWRFGQVAAWRERHGQTVLVAELGGAVNHREDRTAWAADLRQSLPVLRRLRLPVALGPTPTAGTGGCSPTRAPPVPGVPPPSSAARLISARRGAAPESALRPPGLAPGPVSSGAPAPPPSAKRASRPRGWRRSRPPSAGRGPPGPGSATRNTPTNAISMKTQQR
jgi:hypothetical protein